MQENKKSDSSITKRTLARFHERIQNKYIEMQRKLEISRSVDSLSSISDDYMFRLSSSSSDIKELDDVFEAESDNKGVRRSVTVENLNNHDEILKLDVHEAMSSVTEGKKESIAFFNDIAASVESLLEVSKESVVREDFTPSPTPASPPPRISLRDRIGTRITAARERRREAKEKFEKITSPGVMDLFELEGNEFILTNSNKSDVFKKKTKVATVAVALIEATELENEAATEEKSRLLYCRIRLGTEKRKSKTVKMNGNVVKWRELFNINSFDEVNILEITVWEKDFFIGRSVIDLTEFEKEITHQLHLKLEDATAHVEIFVLLTITGITDAEVIDIDHYIGPRGRVEEMSQKYAWHKFLDDMSDVGWMTVVVYGAQGLCSSDCYCVLELGNNRLYTQTAYRTNDPNWKKALAFKLKDITSILEVTVFSERSSEIVGELDIPIYTINNGELKWYALKDQNLRERAKGNNPRILLEMYVYYNIVKASVQAISPKEPVFLHSEPEFSRYLLSQNWSRLKAVMSATLTILTVIKSMFEWESRTQNTVALVLWLLFWYFHEAWMFPLLFLVPFFWYRPLKYDIRRKTRPLLAEETEVASKEEKPSLIQKINSLSDMIQSVQNGVGKLAGLGESVKNLFNFTVPFLSFLVIFLIICLAIVMFLIPPRFLFMAWAINKYSRKILRPDKKPSNEILDLLSKVPDDAILQNCEELPLLPVSS